MKKGEVAGRGRMGKSESLVYTFAASETLQYSTRNQNDE